MSSKYPRSVRRCLPLWALTLEAALILLFYFFTHYDASLEDQKGLVASYQVGQDLTVMAAIGLGFLTSSFRRHSWSSVAFNLFMLALGVQWAILLDGFLSQFPSGKVVITLFSIRLATMSALSVLISVDAVLGKVNLAQLVVMVLVEVTALGNLRMVISNIFNTDYHMNMMHIYVFAAYFGLSVAWCLPKPLPEGTEDKDQTATIPSLSAMLGALFLWMFWPSFNSALLRSPIERKNAVFNTYYAVAVSVVTAISGSSLAHPQGKISKTYVHSAVLAGGVAVGTSCHLIPSPWLAMVLGLVAGLISVGGAKYLPGCCNRVLGIPHSSIMGYNFSLLGLLGEIIYIVLLVLDTVGAGNGMIGFQVLLSIGELSLAIVIALTSGLLTVSSFGCWILSKSIQEKQGLFKNKTTSSHCCLHLYVRNAHDSKVSNVRAGTGVRENGVESFLCHSLRRISPFIMHCRIQQ
ncbi:Rh blood group D antigen [Homo sapiens]|uniref:RhD n=1 Tax=Homo sapiens TaxID=9606 RepID=Q5XLT0_HUMAN|nr:blood group Rh(D) polypeptide isoform 6 [Homo sapiens]AAU93638.1 Rhesus blood group D antigen isoform 3 [Homo sapiens]ASF62455.1 RhD [Homo sapiens]KAI2515629.1 Rh blood group D antigen [Homo sapiens]KAI4079195.1 Rh blood group D antigen [Homo sapiens]|eukprot:NP_001269799.1 blood group Rh(D) polypeptide isoform 6 [Homo sapiens]